MLDIKGLDKFKDGTMLLLLILEDEEDGIVEDVILLLGMALVSFAVSILLIVLSSEKWACKPWWDTWYPNAVRIRRFDEVEEEIEPVDVAVVDNKLLLLLLFVLVWVLLVSLTLPLYSLLLLFPPILKSLE